MLVSGGKIIAIDGVNTNSATLSGDGVFTPLGVNTDKIATTAFVQTEDNKIKNTLSSVSSTLNEKITTVSSDLSAEIDKKQIQLVFQGENNRITAIGPSGGSVSSVGGNVVDVKAGNSTTVTTAKDQQTGITTYTVSLTAEPTDTIVSGENGLSSRQNGNTFFVGLSSTYENAIKKVSSISADVTALSSNKLDKSAFVPSNFYPMSGNPSGFLTAHQSLSSYYTKQQVDDKFISTSSWANTTFLTKNSADGLYYPLNTNPKGYLTESDISADKWNSVYTTVNTASGGWNLISSVSALTGLQNFKQLLIYKEGQQGVQYTIEANGSAASLSFVQGDNISLTTAGESIKLSAKDTTYSPGNYIEIVTAENNKINAVGLQPSGDYVSATDFNEFKEKVEDEFEQTSAWVEENFLSANALDEIKNLSGKWDAASDEVTSHSANWNSVYETVQTNSGDWEEITKVKTFKTIGGIDATTSADSLEFSAGENIKIGINEGKIYVSSHDTTYDENDFISASHLDNIVSVSSTVTSNSADWSSAASALEASADKWNTTHEQFNTSSVKWNELYDEYQVSSKLWNDTTDVVNTFSGDWNEVSAKANSADLEELSGKVGTLSGELKTASAYIEDQIDVLSGAIDDISDDIEYISGDVEKKLYTEDFEVWSADADITPYSAGYGLTLNPDHTFNVSAGMFALSADVDNIKEDIIEQLKDLGYYVCEPNEVKPNGEPNESVLGPKGKLSTSKIYLVLDSTAPTPDQYKEWIWDGTDWTCIGDTSMSLSEYLKKSEASALYQPKGNYVTSSTNEISAVDEYYGLINDNGDVKWAKIPDNTTYTAGKNIVISGNDNEISVNGLFNTTLTSTNDSVGITATTDANGNIQYNLGVNTIPGISGINGVSAYYDETDDQYVVGLEEHTYSYAEAQTSLTTLTTNPETITGFNNKKIIGDNISFVNDVINLEPGLYHIDIQVYLPIPGGDNNYYNVQLIPSKSYATLDQIVDGSFNHNDTLDLSFDIQLDSADTLTFELNGLPPGYKYLVKNIQIHEVTTIDSIMDATGGTYRGGVATNIDNENKINVQYNTASGLAVDPVTNMLYVKLGEGLKFDTSGAAAGSLSLNNITQEVVETVQALKTELDGKLTTNFPYPMINNNNTDFANYKGNGDNCICQLFSVSLTHKITTDTYFTVYMKDSGYSQTNVIFGIFEYNFDYWDETEQRWRGQTNWVCDTGPVSLAKPTADTKLEFKVTHINPLHNELRSDRAYYAVLALKSDSGNGVFLACCDNYDGDVHSEPTLNWRWESVPNLDFVNPSGTLENTQWWDSGVNNYHEKADMRRFFLQIRNKVQPATNP